MKLIDSSVLIAFFRKNDSCHNQALDLFFKFDRFLVLDYVLAETLTVLKQKSGQSVTAACNDFIQNSDCFVWEKITSDYFLDTVEFVTSTNNKLSFVDTLLLLKSKRENLEILTFDKELKKIADNFI
jgi:predicted nucleic acid-binding protein